MEKSFDQWAKELQEMILEEDRKIFSPQVIDHYLYPKNLKEVSDPSSAATVTGPCGDTMYIGVKIVGDRIMEIGFLTDGCGPTVACGSMITQMVSGKTLLEASAFGSKELLEALGGLPDSHLHCAQLAVDALQQTLKDCQGSGGKSDAKR